MLRSLPNERLGASLPLTDYRAPAKALAGDEWLVLARDEWLVRARSPGRAHSQWWNWIPAFAGIRIAMEDAHP